MDPKQNANPSLDPKLQAAYDKVMGVNLSGDTTSTMPPANPPVQDPLATPQPTMPSDQPVMPPAPTPPEPTPNPMPVVDPMPNVPPSAPLPNPVSDETTNTPPVMPTPMQPESTPPSAPIMPDAAAAESLHATISMPAMPAAAETVKIGIGGNPVAGTKPSHKGISPVILIFGAFVFLVVYAIFWIKFFGYTLPFLPK